MNQVTLELFISIQALLVILMIFIYWLIEGRFYDKHKSKNDTKRKS